MGGSDKDCKYGDDFYVSGIGMIFVILILVLCMVTMNWQENININTDRQTMVSEVVSTEIIETGEVEKR